MLRAVKPTGQASQHHMVITSTRTVHSQCPILQTIPDVDAAAISQRTNESNPEKTIRHEQARRPIQAACNALKSELCRQHTSCNPATSKEDQESKDEGWKNCVEDCMLACTTQHGQRSSHISPLSSVLMMRRCVRSCSPWRDTVYTALNLWGPAVMQASPANT